MTDKDLKKLSRIELLEMLVDLSKENETLKNKLAETEEERQTEIEALNAKYREEIDMMQKQLEDRKIAIAKAGSIAEACLQINGIFEAVQASAEQYLENVRHSEEICRQMEMDANIDIMEKMARADMEAQKHIEDAKLKAEQLLSETKKRSEKMIEDAQAKTSSYWESVSQRLSVFYKEHQGLKELLSINSGNEN